MSIITNDNLKSALALAALQDVYDPEFGLSVVDLGLIYQLDFDAGNKKIFCTMALTTQYCPMGESILNKIKQALAATFQDEAVELNLTFEPAWSYQMISEEGKQFFKEVIC